MSIIQIPLPQSEPDFTQQATLDGEVYTLHIKWNQREESWYLDLLDVDQTQIVMSRKMVADWPLLHRTQSTLQPPGELFVTDLSETGTDPTLANLGKDVILVYLDEAELAL